MEFLVYAGIALLALVIFFVWLMFKPVENPEGIYLGEEDVEGGIKQETLSVVGVSFDNDDGESRQDVIKRFSKYNEEIGICLYWQPENKFDKNAIAIFMNNEQVGHISKEEAKTVMAYYKKGCGVRAALKEIVGGTKELPTYGVVIEILIYLPKGATEDEINSGKLERGPNKIAA